MNNLPTPPRAVPKPYYAPIDGVRSLCVLLVLLDHLKYTGAGSISFVNGHRGVDIFFVISGFLISTLLLREERSTGKIDLSAFYWRRAFRILPIYSVVLLIYIAVCQFPSQAAKWVQLKGGLPYFLLFMNEYVKEPNHGNVFTHTWSLGVEEKFYLLWPVLFFVLAKTARARIIVLALLFIPMAIAPFVGQGYLGGSYFGLLMGCVMAVLLGNETTGFARLLRRVPSPAMAAVLFLGFYLEQHNHNLMVVFSTAIVLFLSFLIVKSTWLSAILGGAPLVWLGRRSYSMYLVHILCLNAVEALMPINTGLRALVAVVLAYSLTAGVAALLYITVEEPARKYGKRFIARRRQAKSLAQASLTV